MDLDVYLQKAVSFFKSGNLNEAEKICNDIKKKDPNNVINLNLLGIILFQKKEFSNSINIIKESIKLNFKQAETHNNLGIASLQIKNFLNAIEAFKNSIKINPKFIEAYINIGVALKQINKNQEAIEYWKEAIQLKKNNPRAYNNIGNVYFEMNKPEISIEYYNNAISFDNKFYNAYFNRGNAKQKMNLLTESIKDYTEAIRINNNYAEAYVARGNSLRNLNKLSDALKDYEKGYKINPNYQNLFGNIFYIKKNLCDWKNYNNEYLFLNNNIQKDNKIINPFISLSTFNSPEIQKKIAKEHFQKKLKNKNNVSRNIVFKNIKIKDKIKVGYYSSDFKNHAMSQLLAGLFEMHNRDKFEIIGFSLIQNKSDEFKERITKSFDTFIDVSSKSEKEIAEISRNLDIDIAVDLMGYTKSNRFEIFIEKCAPIQINFLGYPGTLGSDCIDYIIADKTLITKNEEKFYSEKIIYLPDTYQSNDSKRIISKKKISRKDFDLPENKFIFCCFNKKYKFDPNMYEIWMNILKKVNNSVLWLLDDENESTTNLIYETKLRNIDPKRIIFSKKIPTHEHLARHSLADLFLDTFPYGAHTTASDALWSGLPVITKKGNSFASRVASSLLKAISMDELITSNDQEYQDLAVRLATDKKQLDLIKYKLSKNIKTEPLFNTLLFTSNIEKAYKLANNNFVKNLPVENIEI